MQLKKQRAHELAVFLKCLPSDVSGDPKKYVKMQNLRKALIKALDKYEDIFTEFTKKMDIESKPFQDASAEFRFNAELQKEKGREFQLQLQEIMKEDAERVDDFIKDYGDEVISVIVNSEDLSQCKLFFEKPTKIQVVLCDGCKTEAAVLSEPRDTTKGAEFWLNGDHYIEIAEVLGCLN